MATLEDAHQLATLGYTVGWLCPARKCLDVTEALCGFSGVRRVVTASSGECAEYGGGGKIVIRHSTTAFVGMSLDAIIIPCDTSPAGRERLVPCVAVSRFSRRAEKSIMEAD